MKKRKAVIITGASKRIGKDMASLFASEGYQVLLSYYKSSLEVYRTHYILREKGQSVEVCIADITKRKQTDLLVELCIKLFGKVDILINYDGIAQQKLFMDATEKEWDVMMNSNLKGVNNCIQSVLQYMLKQKEGKIINISSIWGMVGDSCEVHYSAAKTDVIGLTKAQAKELAPFNIQVNCIAPTMKIGSPEDIASCALYLASEGADFVTGQVISPDGEFANRNSACK